VLKGKANTNHTTREAVAFVKPATAAFQTLDLRWSKLLVNLDLTRRRRLGRRKSISP
jgi:hypothetical protein